MKRPLAGKREETAKRKRGRGRPFGPNNTANPSGRPKLPDDLKAALVANSLPLYEKGLRLLDDAIAVGNFGAASTLLLGLLKKSVPDAATLLELTGKDGAPLAIGAAQLRAMSDDDLATVRAIAERACAPKP